MNNDKNGKKCKKSKKLLINSNKHNEKLRISILRWENIDTSMNAIRRCIEIPLYS
jgi:TnpA family transposase